MTLRRVFRMGAMALVVAALLVVGCEGGDGATPQVLATLDLPPVATPTPKPVDPAVAAFVKLATSGKLSYHASYKGTVAASITTLFVTGQLDVSGDDYSTSTRYKYDRGGVYTVGVRYVGGKAWVAIGGAWKRLTTFPASRSNSPFASITAIGDLKVGASSGTGANRRVHVTFARSRLLTPDQIPAVNLSEERVTDSAFDLVIDDSGHPVSGDWTLKGSGRVSRQMQDIVMQIHITFSKVGGRIAISAP
ncbi:MAG TPA: hypothetical protein VKA85_10540 [Candidatus Limnocylindrales bacterium]|nr:hypothetical protein [Candidatus Limnocylindrales bacterium]